MQIKSLLFWIVLFIVLYFLFRYFMGKGSTLSSLANAQISQTLTLTAADPNQPAGNFCYSYWVYVQDWNYRYGNQKILFTRADAAPTGDKDATSGSPLVYLDKYQNNLFVIIDTFATGSNEAQTHTCMVENLPIQKWVHIYISVYQRELDIYLDGKLVRTCLMENISRPLPTQQVFLTPNGGFSGWTSKFQYFARPGNPQEAWNIYRQGYGGESIFGNLFGNYKVKVALVQGDTENKSITL